MRRSSPSPQAVRAPPPFLPPGRPLTATTVERVEQLAGLTLLPDALKLGARQLCQSTRCELVVRRFDDAQKRAKK
jgi:endonuclease G